VFWALTFVLNFALAAHPTSSTFLRNPSDLRMINIRILAERPMGDRTEIEFTADFQNLDTGRFADVTVMLVSSNAAPSLITVDGMLQFPTVAESATVTGDSANSLIVTVANSDLTSTRAAILAGTILEFTAMEEMVFAAPARYIDAPTDDGYTSTIIAPLGGYTLVFSNNIALVQSLSKGDLLLADPGPGGYRPKVPTGFAQPHLAQYIPFEVDSVAVVGERTHVNGNKRTITEIMKSGTFVGDTATAYGGGRDPYNPPVENTYSDEEQAARDVQAVVERENDPNSDKLADLAGLNAVPIRFNQVRIGEAIDLSGEVLLRSSGLKFQITMRDFEFTRAVAHIDAGLVANMVLETVSSNNNVSVPIFEKEKRLVFVPLPPVPITIAGLPMTLGGNFSLTVGAEVMAPGGISIPIQSAIIVGAEVGWDNGQTLAAPVAQFVRPQISDPRLFEAVEVSARAWAEARFELTFGDALQIVSTGPSLAVRAEGKFTANPFANPWWTMKMNGELLGAFNLNLLTFNVVGAEASFYKATFYTNDAGGPFIASPPLPKTIKRFAVTAATKSFEPVVGSESRWAVAFQPKPGQGSYSHGGIAPLAGGDIFTFGSNALMTFFARWAPDGTLVWLQNFPSLIRTVAGTQLRDGRIALLGKSGLDWFVAFYDADGNQLSFKRYNIGNSVDVTDMAVSYTAAGEANLIVVGYKNQTIVTDSDPFIIKLDANGEVLWSRIFELPGDDEFFGVTALRDGGYVVGGRTSADAVTDPRMNGGRNGFLTKVSSDGDLVWSQAIESRWSMVLNDVVESADGTLFATGANGDLVWNYYPSIVLAKFGADGELIDHVLLGEDPDEEDMLPLSGDTPYDAATEIVWSEDGLYIVGKTGLGHGTAGFVAALTEELGVRWFSSFDGPRADAIEDIQITHEGLTLMGWSDSIMPFGTGGEHSLMLMRYPFEGILRLHPDTGVQTAYLQPRTFLSSQDLHFMVVDNSNPQQPVFMRTTPVSGSFNALVKNESLTEVPIGVRVTPTLARLDRIEPTLITAMDDWEAYHQIPTDGRGALADADRDGRPNAEEFFFGTNPHKIDASPVPELRLEQSGATTTAVLRYQRPPWATFPLLLQGATDLNSPFAPITDHVSVDGELGGGLYGEVRHELGGQNTMFYRVGIQVP
jgi:hypothetical protein